MTRGLTLTTAPALWCMLPALSGTWPGRWLDKSPSPSTSLSADLAPDLAPDSSHSPSYGLSPEKSPSPSPGQSPGMPPELRRLLELKSEAYERQALLFSCTERIETTHFHKGIPGRRESSKYLYLLVHDEGFGQLVAYRSRPGARAVREVHVRTGAPEPYAWLQMLSSPIRTTVHWAIGGGSLRGLCHRPAPPSAPIA